MRSNQDSFLSISLVFLMVICIGMLIPTSAQDNMLDCMLGDTMGEIANAKLYIEYQSSDGDVGVHGLFAGEPWAEMCIYDPNGKLILAIDPQSEMNNLGLADIFFESNEPLLEDLPFETLMEMFVEGQYEVYIITVDGTLLAGAATFTHNIPTPPVITAPVLAKNEDEAENVVVSTADLMIEWDDVTETIDGRPVTITGYEIIITNDDHEDPHGWSRPVFDVHVPPDRNSLSIPIEFLESDTLYELEVLALEESGNQTITVGFFTTE